MSHRKLTRDELIAEAKAAFGDDREKWAFCCPHCGDVAVAQDFRDADADPNSLGQECIGRHLGALAGPPTTDAGRSIAKRGCDWAAYGFLGGPWTVTLPDGNHMGVVKPGVEVGDRHLLATGAVVAVVDLVDICTDSARCYCGRWAPIGLNHWKLDNVRPLAEPVLARGKQGLWDIDLAVPA